MDLKSICLLLVGAFIIASTVQSKDTYPQYTDYQKRGLYHIKRSLCNTFGGCGAKRSMQRPPMTRDNSFNLEARQDEPFLFNTDKAQNFRINNDIASPPDKLFSDVLEYMQNSEMYRQ